MIENGSFRHSGRVVKASDLSQKIDITWAKALTSSNLVCVILPKGIILYTVDILLASVDDWHWFFLELL